MWVVLSAIVVIVGAAFVFWMNVRGVKLTWYEWLIGIIGFFLVLFTIQNYFGSINEAEPKAARMFLLVTGLPAVILLALSWALFYRRKSVKTTA